MADKSEILLESGTGEVEILHFRVAGEDYAINVVKVKEILKINNISKVPNADPKIAGVSLIRDEIMSVIDMTQVLENVKTEDIESSMSLVCEFNKLKVVFAIDEVLGITRIHWGDILKPDNVTSNSLIIGNINMDNNILMLLDFEKIVMDISPSTGINVDRIGDIEEIDRKDYKIVLADDSPLIRSVLENVLSKAGIKQMKFFDDGQEALDYIMKSVDEKGIDFLDDINLLITDIEMPRLDGHTLTRTIKEHKIAKNLPVIIFSSLITGDLFHKGQAVGADGQMSKPEIDKLINLVDELLNI